MPGAVPVMLRGTGSSGTELAEVYFCQLTCGYTRHTFNKILENRWDFLDGAVIFNSCDHMRRIYDNWIREPGNPVYHFVHAPKKTGDLSRAFFREQLVKFIEATEKKFGVKITDESLAAAIRLRSETRRLQQSVYALQKDDEVYLTGTELMMVMLAGKSMPAEDYNRLLAGLVRDLKANNEVMRPTVRILYAGGHADSQKFFETLETHGAQIVVDQTGFGSGSCEVLVREDGNPLEALVSFYMDEAPASPRKFGTFPERIVRDYKIDGVIMTRVTFCDLWAMEQYIMRFFLQEKKIPTLELEVDYVPEGLGQITTRVQAFCESILYGQGK